MEIETRQQIREMVDAAIDTFVTTRVSQAEKSNQRFGQLWRSIKALTDVGGKRMRPYSFMLSYRAFGGSAPLDAIMPIAVAFELIHLAMLVHDDIIDRDDIRYGVKNVSGQYLDEYSTAITDASERVHFSHSAALLAGDLLLSAAYESIAKAGIPARDRLRAQSRLTNGIFAVIGGELIDMEAPFYPEIDHLDIARQKTASYSFVMPLITGAELAGASLAQLETLTRAAESLGIAFQLQDDILGVFGDPQKTGKSNDSDLREGKRTMLIDVCLACADDPTRRVLHRTLGNANAPVEDFDAVRDAIRKSGALETIRSHIADYAQSAADSIRSLQLTPHADAEMRAFVTQFAEREY